MAAGYVADAHFTLGSGERVQHCHGAVNSSALADLLYGFVVLLGGDERQQLVGRGGRVSFRYRLCSVIQGDDDGLGVFGDGFVGDVLKGSVNHVGLLEVGKVAYAAAYAALEYEDVTLPRQAGAI